MYIADYFKIKYNILINCNGILTKNIISIRCNRMHRHCILRDPKREALFEYSDVIRSYKCHHSYRYLRMPIPHKYYA